MRERDQDDGAEALRRRYRRARERRAVWEGHWAFSCWNEGDPNRAKLEAVDAREPAFALCLDIAAAALAGRLADPTGGATHYHAAGVSPWWARGHSPCARIGRHVFYRGVD